MGTNEKQSSALPFETKMGFVAIPKAVCEFYVRHPKFTEKVERIYRYLLQMYNSEVGYAWPNYSHIRQATGIGSDSTIAKALETLEYLGLIQIEKRKTKNGLKTNVYRFLPPIEDEAEFMRRFGEDMEDATQSQNERDDTEDLTEEERKLLEWL